ncbi:MAG: hypothetical protein HC876_06085 [Chloroflexaceae bacterium]|nr:hypothetical protein [Chloroflexaceae bacterium]
MTSLPSDPSASAAPSVADVPTSPPPRRRIHAGDMGLRILLILCLVPYIGMLVVLVNQTFGIVIVQPQYPLVEVTGGPPLDTLSKEELLAVLEGFEYFRPVRRELRAMPPAERRRAAVSQAVGNREQVGYTAHKVEVALKGHARDGRQGGGGRQRVGGHLAEQVSRRFKHLWVGGAVAGRLVDDGDRAVEIALCALVWSRIVNLLFAHRRFSESSVAAPIARTASPLRVR